jgi:hypothetical protein
MHKRPINKKWYKSKLIWFNIALGVGTALEASLGIIQGYFDPRVYFGITGIAAGVNVLLRTITTQGIGNEPIDDNDPN